MIIYFSYRLGIDRGTYLASERTVDIMIAMGYLEEKDPGEIIKKSKDDNQANKMFEPSKDRLIRNARRMMLTAQNPQFKNYWERVLTHLLKVYNRYD